MPPSHTDAIICALDTTDIARARTLCGELKGHVGAIKLGLEFFTANGAEGVLHMADQAHVPIFLDLKFHDIPNTVAGAIRAAAGIDAFMMTVHAAGGHAMLKAAVEASMEVAAITGKERPYIIGVTVLTSLDEHDLDTLGIGARVDEHVKRLAELAQAAGLDGVVCSPHEIADLRQQCGDNFMLVVPGIRPDGAANGDQKRVMSPRQAIELGADYLVIGRPITGAESPAQAAHAIAESLGS